jgi:hypothetical protein
MAIKIVNDDSLTEVANAIRVKAEISGTLEFPDGFVSAVENIPAGGGGKQVQVCTNTLTVKGKTETTSNNFSITVEKTGVYNVYWVQIKGSSATVGYLCVNGEHVGSVHNSYTIESVASRMHEDNVSLNEGDLVQVSIKNSVSSAYGYASILVIEEV